MKKTLTAAALTAILAGATLPAVAIAQDGAVTSPATPPAATSEVPAADAANIRAGALIGAPVTNSAGEDVGKVTDLLIGTDNKISAAVISVGGFLGVGDKQVALSLSELTVRADQDGDLSVKVAASKDQLKAMPEIELN